MAPRAGLMHAAMRCAAERHRHNTLLLASSKAQGASGLTPDGFRGRRTVQSADGAARHEEPVVRGGPSGADAAGQARERRALHQREHGRRLIRVHIGVRDADQPVTCGARGRARTRSAAAAGGPGLWGGRGLCTGAVRNQRVQVPPIKQILLAVVIAWAWANAPARTLFASTPAGYLLSATRLVPACAEHAFAFLSKA